MAKEKLEKEAEKKYCKGCKLRMEQCLWAWRNTNGLNEPNGKNCSCKEVPAFLAGLKAGRPQWHDLRKDPTDLPKDSGIKLCYTRTAKYVCASYDEEYGCWGFIFNNLEHCIPSSVIIVWCEIPTFDKE